MLDPQVITTTASGRRRAMYAGARKCMSRFVPPPAVPIVEKLPDYVPKAANPRHVLIIEDRLDSVHTLVVLLRDMGHVVDYAINGYVGLDMARRMRPEFILLDIGLPGLDGYEVCKRLRADPALQDTKVVMVTAYSDHEHREKSRAAGCHMYLVKPVPVRVLEDLLG
jgi:CheY-like chemotaxis protein